MTTTEALRARLLAHAEIHEADMAHDEEQRQWAADLREAAAALSAIDALPEAPSVEPVAPAVPVEPMTERDHFDLERWHLRLGELADAYYEAGRTNPARQRARAELMMHALDCATGWRARSKAAATPQAQPAASVEPDEPAFLSPRQLWRDYKAAQAQPAAVPLTDAQFDALWRAPMSADWEHREYGRAIEITLAKAWGVKLAGIIPQEGA